MNTDDKHPIAERCAELGMIFLGLVESEPPQCKVDMGEHRYNACGTAACHAGWFGVSQISGRPKEYGDDEVFLYNDAADDMANFVGMCDADDLKGWADENPGLWGNEHGDAMFADNGVGGEAFGKDTPTLQDIGMHWLKVSERIKVMEDAVKTIKGIK